MTRIAALPHRTLIRVSGPDSIPFLKGLCTAHLDAIGADSAAGRFHSLHYGAFLRPQGKMICDVVLSAVAKDEIWLDLPAVVRDDLLAKLRMYRLRAQVNLEPLDNPVFVAFDGTLPDGFAADPRGRVVGTPFGISYAPQSANATLEDWDRVRIPLGLADPGRDFASDDLYPIDANLDVLGAIDFHKGCYIGQELTSRMKRRGQIKNRILPLEGRGPVQGGAEVTEGERRVGQVLTSVGTTALALIRLDRMDGSVAECDGVPVEIHTPPWLDRETNTLENKGK
jgi:hypothetical protein